MISMAIKAKNEELDLGPLPRKTRDQFSESVCIIVVTNLNFVGMMK